MGPPGVYAQQHRHRAPHPLQQQQQQQAQQQYPGYQPVGPPPTDNMYGMDAMGMAADLNNPWGVPPGGAGQASPYGVGPHMAAYGGHPGQQQQQQQQRQPQPQPR